MTYSFALMMVSPLVFPLRNDDIVAIDYGGSLIHYEAMIDASSANQQLLAIKK